MYAVKQAVMAADHSETPLECTIFYMDLRTQGKDFDRYCENARKSGVRFIPARIHTVERIPGTDDLLLRYADDSGATHQDPFDMVVLSTGLEVNRDNRGRIVANPGNRIGPLPFYPFELFSPGGHLGGRESMPAAYSPAPRISLSRSWKPVPPPVPPPRIWPTGAIP